MLKGCDGDKREKLAQRKRGEKTKDTESEETNSFKQEYK